MRMVPSSSVAMGYVTRLHKCFVVSERRIGWVGIFWGTR